MLNTTDFSTQ